MASNIASVSRIEAKLEDWHWSWSAQNEQRIAAHWQSLSGDNPHVYDGTVLLMHRGELDGDIYRSGYFKTPYSHFMALRDWGVPDPSVRNGFACAALKTLDGAYLLGVMGPQTSNAGKIYFAAGTPDLEDCQGDHIDIAGSALRELTEETGFRVDQLHLDETITLVDDGFRVAFLCHATLQMDTVTALEHFARWNAKQSWPELADLYVLRTRADLRPAQMHTYLLNWFETVLP